MVGSPCIRSAGWGRRLSKSLLWQADHTQANRITRSDLQCHAVTTLPARTATLHLDTNSSYARRHDVFLGDIAHRCSHWTLLHLRLIRIDLIHCINILQGCLDVRTTCSLKRHNCVLNGPTQTPAISISQHAEDHLIIVLLPGRQGHKGESASRAGRAVAPVPPPLSCFPRSKMAF